MKGDFLFQLVLMFLCMSATAQLTSNPYMAFAVGFGLGFFGFTINVAADKIIAAIKGAKK